MTPEEYLKARLFSQSFEKQLHSVDSPVAKKLLELPDLRDKDEIKNITMRRNEQVLSFLPAGKESILKEGNHDDLVWDKTNRQSSKIGKLVQKLIDTSDLHEKDMEEFVNKLKAINRDGDFQIVSGEDIRYWYNGDRYASDCNTLSSSCMKHDECEDFFDIYVENPDKCKMLILKDGTNHLIGRAILWTTDDGTKLMDRIYGTDSTIEKFKQWANENGYIHKFRQSYDHPDTWGEEENVQYYRISLDFNTRDSFPYLDTFKYIAEDFISNNEDDAEIGVANETDGSLADSYETCAYCGGRLDLDFAIEVSDGDGYACDDCAVIDYDGEGILRDNAVYLEDRGEYYHDDHPDLIFVESVQRMMHYDDTIECEYDNEPYPEDDDFEEIDGYTVHESNVDAFCKKYGYEYDQQEGEFVSIEEESEYKLNTAAL